MKYKVFKSLQRLFAFEQLEGYKGTYKYSKIRRFKDSKTYLFSIGRQVQRFVDVV